jgi:smad nuclear-interacting protein 1
VFKGAEEVGAPLRLHRASAFLFGRDREVADVPVDHPSCSKQHAVIQFRLVAPRAGADDGFVAAAARRARVLPYLLDLESTNGTFLNARQVEPARYVELRAGDVLRFGESTREFVLLFDEQVA